VYSTKQGVFYPVGTLALIALAAYLARLVWDAVRYAQEKSLLRSAFSGHVSPQVMRAILSGKLQPDRDGENCQATILFCDIRGFTTRAESATPEAMMTLLNRFYAEVTAAVHARAGAIDKFLGDGLLATFGVLQPLKSPQRSALEAAQEILVRISRLNQALQAQGLAPIEVGIGIHCGPVLAGYVGSRKRREFTVMGDVVNTAFGLEGLTKVLGLPVVCSESVARAVGFSAGLQDMGEQAIKGRAAMRVWGWRPPLVKHAKGAAVC
jgi:adenylate cyclase